MRDASTTTTTITMSVAAAVIQADPEALQSLVAAACVVQRTQTPNTTKQKHKNPHLQLFR